MEYSYHAILVFALSLGVLTLIPSAFASTFEVTTAQGADVGSTADCVAANNCFNPSTVSIASGDTVHWTFPYAGHTVTSGKGTDNQTGTVFDSGLVARGSEYSFTFQNEGTYDYFCMVHPWMTGRVIVGNGGPTPTPPSPTPPPPQPIPAGVDVIMTQGSGSGSSASCVYTNNCFSPSTLTVALGAEVTWYNGDSAAGHTVTSGHVTDTQTGTLFDSGLIKYGSEFSFTFQNQGTYDYFCMVHPWMTGQVIVSASTGGVKGGGGTMTTVEAMSKDASTKVTVDTTPADPTSGQPLTIALTFTDANGNKIQHQNYAITVTQSGTTVLDNQNGHTHTGDDTQTTDALKSADPVDIQVTLKGVGLPTSDPSTWTGPKGDMIRFHVVPEFGSASNSQPLRPPPMSPLGPPTTVEVTTAKGADGGSTADCVAANNCFDPSTVTVAPGDTVHWSFPYAGHTVTSGKATDNQTGTVFDSGLVARGSEYSFTFQNEGTYDYFCMVHPWMTGQVIVESSGAGNAYHAKQIPGAVYAPTQQDIQNINQAKASQTIAAEINVGSDKASTTSIDSNVSVQTTINNPDSLDAKVSAPDQTGPKVIMFNLPATTINIANLKDLGIMYDGRPISPALSMDAILHAKPTDNPSFAIVVTQSGIQVLVLIPHFTTHTITLTNMSKVVPTVPEFPYAMVVLIIGIIVTLVMRGINRNKIL